MEKGQSPPPSYQQVSQGPEYPNMQYPPQQGQFIGQPPMNQYAPQPQFAGQPQVYGNVVVQQAGPYAANTYQAPPHDYTTQAWIACLCCFWPTGILAIMKASESRDALARGDFVRAHEAAKSARTMVRISWIAGVVSIIAALVIVGVYVGIVVNSLNDYDY